MKTILLLEDNDERIAGFRNAVGKLGADWALKVWPDAPTMVAECDAHFEHAALISLDHDLNPLPGSTADPGTGLDVAKFLAGHWPCCPVIIHSSNTDRAWSMHNELRFAKWPVDRVGPIGEDWIEKLWLPKARELLAQGRVQRDFRKPADHESRLARALVSLEGVALGDAIGEMLAYRHSQAQEIIARGLPAGPWFHTDDAEMAISIIETLRLYGHIHQDALARRFAWHFEREPDRGYGSMTRKQMREVLAGADWRETATQAFGGQGSMGNGGAMRVAPLGAYFADDLERVAEQARLSAVVTHTHPEGVAGTIAVAVAAAMAWQLKESPAESRPGELFKAVLDLTPESNVRRRLLLALTASPDTPLDAVVRGLGNGSQVTATDTVPLALWCAAHRLDDFVEAIGFTISAGGDCDTNAAIVGGIVSLATGLAGIPSEWRKERERLPFDQQTAGAGVAP